MCTHACEKSARHAPLDLQKVVPRRQQVCWDLKRAGRDARTPDAAACSAYHCAAYHAEQINTDADARRAARGSRLHGGSPTTQSLQGAQTAGGALLDGMPVSACPLWEPSLPKPDDADAFWQPRGGMSFAIWMQAGALTAARRLAPAMLAVGAGAA